MPEHTRQERLAEFLRRLRDASPAADGGEARTLLEATLNAVEDEMTEIPFNMDVWRTDGRMYPPHDDQKRVVRDRPDLTLFRHRAHDTLIRTNGAIEIRLRRGRDRKVILSKVGADGRGVDP